MLRDAIAKDKESSFNCALSDSRKTSDNLMRELKFNNIAIVAEIYQTTDFKIDS